MWLFWWCGLMTPQIKARSGSLGSNCRDCDCMRHNARADYCAFWVSETASRTAQGCYDRAMMELCILRVMEFGYADTR